MADFHIGSGNYSNTTYFQLWTKCRDWSQSKPAENAIEKKRSLLLSSSSSSQKYRNIYMINSLHIYATNAKSNHRIKMNITQFLLAVNILKMRH